MCIIVVASDRAGAGKTTAVLSLAAALAEMGSAPPTVLIDLDPHGDATRRMGVAREAALLGPLIDGRRNPTDAIGSFDVRDAAHPTSEGFAIVPASEDIGDVERRFGDRSGGKSLLVYRLHALGRDCHLVIDTAPGVRTYLGRAVIQAADVVIVPVFPRPGADRDVTAVVAVLRGMGGSAHVFVVAAQADGTGADVARLNDALRDDDLAVDESFPHESAMEQCASSIGTPLALAPTSQCAASYHNLARKIDEVIAERRSLGLLVHSQLPA